VIRRSFKRAPAPRGTEEARKACEHVGVRCASRLGPLRGRRERRCRCDATMPTFEVIEEVFELAPDEPRGRRPLARGANAAMANAFTRHPCSKRPIDAFSGRPVRSQRSV
jgi:hypothetical protein